MAAIKSDKSVIIIFVGLLAFISLYWYTYNNRQCSETIIMVSENKENVQNDLYEYENANEQNVKVLKKVNLNTASLEELSDIMFVSDKQAKLIVDYRNEFGYFENVNDVSQVKGITMVTLNAINNYTYVT